jgi:hypothetical protein
MRALVARPDEQEIPSRPASHGHVKPGIEVTGINDLYSMSGLAIDGVVWGGDDPVLLSHRPYKATVNKHSSAGLLPAALDV